MAFEPTGGFVWSDERAERDSPWGTGVTLGMTAAAGGTAFAFGVHQRIGGDRPIDDLVRYARTAGNLTPFQVGNTFRIPEFLSPFTSPAYQELKAAGDLHRMTIGREHLTGTSTYLYMKKLTGMDDNQLRAVGLTPGMIGPESQLATQLIYEKAGVGSSGSLYSEVGGKKHLLHANAMLMQFTGESPSITEFSPAGKSVNKAAKSIFQAMDMWKHEGFTESGVFTTGEAGGFARPKFMPIPGIDASWQGSTYMRALPAFSMERFNHLISNVGNEVLGKGFTESIGKVVGLGGVVPGPASSMYTRFGGRAAGVVGVGLAIGELDWLRRQGELPGHMLASGAISAGIGALSAKAGFSPRASMFMGLASFAGQMILPGFNQGVMPGIATTWARSTELRASALNPFNYYRRSVEGFLPGVSGVSMAALAGVASVVLANSRVPGSGRPIPDAILEKFGHRMVGLKSKTSSHIEVRTPKSTRDHFWDMMMDHANKHVSDPEMTALYRQYQQGGKWTSFGMRGKVMAALHRSNIGSSNISDQMNKFWAAAEERHRTLGSQNPVNIALSERLGEIASKYQGRGDMLGKASMQAEGLFEQLKHSFFGASLSEEVLAGSMKKMGFRSPLGSTGLLFATAFTAHQLLTGGALGSMESREELQDIYSGRQLVDVQKGRFWEMGGTPLEGWGSQQLRPHWYPIMMNRVRQQGVWGADEDSLSPISKFWKSNFTYELEKRNYYDRPYPISTPAFGNLPIIGPMLGSTIGQLIKPAKLMHAGEWIQSTNGNLEFASTYDGWRREPSYAMGAKDPGVPQSPFAPQSVFSELNYQFRELSGLTGWAANTVSNLLVGEDVYFSKDPRLAESGMMNSYRKQFWDMSLGGGGPLGEIVRRVLPQYTKDVERVNPIINNMPTWLPTSFRYGDAYSRLNMGEASLPGAGYIALHPELRGTDAEDYPLIYRYDILAQASPLSDEFRKTRDRLYMERARGYLSPEQEQWVDRIDQMAVKRWNMYDFERPDDHALQLPGSNLTQAAWFGTQELLRKNVAPLEYLIPGGFRPFQKLMSSRDPVEQYEYERLYGTAFSFWDKPWRDWLRPAVYSTANLMGYEGKPLWRKEADRVNGYFDQLEFQKWMMLAQQAEAAGDGRAKVHYEYMAGNTRMGVNPQGNPLSIYWTIPTEDRAFFNAFSYAEGRDRERILAMVPEDQTHLYRAVWDRMDSADPTLWAGGPSGPDQQHLYKQFYNIDNYPAPPEDWIGYNSDVDMRDIKVRYVNELGHDLRDYGLWESEVKKAMSQPFLDGSTQYLHNSAGPGRGAVGKVLHELFDGPDINIYKTNNYRTTASFDYDDDRRPEIQAQLQGYMNGL